MEDWKTRLRAAREACGLNKTEFARQVGVSNPTVTDWEKSVDAGGIREITGPKLTKLCMVLKIDAQWLLYGKKAPAVGVGADDSSQDPDWQLAAVDALDERARDLGELKLLAVYRLADERERRDIEGFIEDTRRDILKRVQGHSQSRKRVGPG